MKQTFITPVKIMINGKFFCIAQEVEIYTEEASKKQGITPHTWIGQVIDIKKDLPRAREEKKKAKEAAKKASYDEFWKRAKDAIDDPSKRIPIDGDVLY